MIVWCLTKNNGDRIYLLYVWNERPLAFDAILLIDVYGIQLLLASYNVSDLCSVCYLMSAIRAMQMVYQLYILIFLSVFNWSVCVICHTKTTLLFYFQKQLAVWLATWLMFKFYFRELFGLSRMSIHEYLEDQFPKRKTACNTYFFHKLEVSIVPLNKLPNSLQYEVLSLHICSVSRSECFVWSWLSRLPLSFSWGSL